MRRLAGDLGTAGSMEDLGIASLGAKTPALREFA
jgi:hypothetical protein